MRLVIVGAGGFGKTVKDIADQLKLSEVNFIKRVGNIQDFTVIEVNRLCDILNIKGEDAIRVFFA